MSIVMRLWNQYISHFPLQFHQLPKYGDPLAEKVPDDHILALRLLLLRPIICSRGHISHGDMSKSGPAK